MDDTKITPKSSLKTKTDEDWQINFTLRSKNLPINIFASVFFFVMAGVIIILMIKNGLSSNTLEGVGLVILLVWLGLIFVPWRRAIIEKYVDSWGEDRLGLTKVRGIAGILKFYQEVILSTIITWNYSDEKKLLRFKVHFQEDKSKETYWVEFFLNGIGEKNLSFITGWLNNHVPKPAAAHK